MIQVKLAVSKVDIVAARLLAYRVLELKHCGRSFALDAAIAELFTSEIAQRVDDQVLKIQSAYCKAPEYPIERINRAAFMSRIYY